MSTRDDVVDLLWRAALKVGYRVLCVWWFVRRPRVDGAYVVVRRPATDANGWELLVVHNSYKRGVTVPCGGTRRGETHAEAACRELREEVGLVATPEQLRPLGEIVLRHRFREDHAHFHELVLEAGRPPDLHVDRREVVRAEFLPIPRVRDLDLVPHVRAFLDRTDFG